MHGFSIIIPVKAINDYIHESVPISLGLNYKDFEIIILPNDEPTGLLPEYLCDPRVRIVPSGKVSPAVKRDLGAELARFDYLAFMDDDAYPTADWLKVAERLFKETGAAALGGPGLTPGDSSLSEKASGLFYETLIGGGGMAYRYRPVGRSFWVDDFPTVNLIVQKSAFMAVGGFDNEFWPGEDTKFCLDLTKAGYKIWYSSDLLVYHHRRPKLAGHLRQVGGYGKHRGYFVKRFPETSARVVYAVPSIFFLGNLGLAFLGLIWPFIWLIWAALLGFYFTLAALDVLIRTRQVKLVFLTVFTVFASHLTYGFMFLRGLASNHNFKSQLR